MKAGKKQKRFQQAAANQFVQKATLTLLQDREILAIKVEAVMRVITRKGRFAKITEADLTKAVTEVAEEFKAERMKQKAEAQGDPQQKAG